MAPGEVAFMNGFTLLDGMSAFEVRGPVFTAPRHSTDQVTRSANRAWTVG